MVLTELQIASGAELDKLGALRCIIRHEGETDVCFRDRLILERYGLIKGRLGMLIQALMRDEFEKLEAENIFIRRAGETPAEFKARVSGKIAERTTGVIDYIINTDGQGG